MKRLPLLLIILILCATCTNKVEIQSEPESSSCNLDSDVINILAQHSLNCNSDSIYEIIESSLYDSILKNHSAIPTNPITKYLLIDSALYSYCFENYLHISTDDGTWLQAQENQLKFSYYYLTKEIKNKLNDTALQLLFDKEKIAIDSLLNAQYSFIDNHKGNDGSAYYFVRYCNASNDLFSTLVEMQKDFYFTLIDNNYNPKPFQPIPPKYIDKEYEEIALEIPNVERADDNLYDATSDLDALITMQLRWDDIYNIRSLICKRLSDNAKQAYINETYRLQRYQLIQLKHRFYGIYDAAAQLLTDSSTYEEIYNYKTDPRL